MRNFTLLFVLFFSVITISAQTGKWKKWSEPKTDTYTIRSHTPSGDGFILSNLNFSSKVSLEQPGRNRFAWNATVYFKNHSMIVKGYVYNGITYSASELLSEFKINLNNSSVFLKVMVAFNNGKNYTSSMGGAGAFHVFDYKKNDENTSFGLRRVSIFSNPRSISIEGAIKRELRIKEQQRKNEEFKKKEKERLIKETEAKRIEEERIKKLEEAKVKERERLNKIREEAFKIQESKDKARKERLRIEKEARDRQFELEKKEIERKAKIKEKAAADKKIKDDLEYYAGRRRTKKALEEEKKKKFEKSKKQLTKATANAFTGVFNGLSDGSLSYFRVGIGMRSDTKEVGDNSFYLSTPSNMTYEFGLGLGGPAGFYMGVGFPDSTWDESSGFSWLAGIEYFVFELEDFGGAFGLNAEFGMGNSDETDHRTNYSLTSTEEAIFYSFGAQLRILKYLYVSYNYGFYSGESKTTYTDNRSDKSEEGTGNFSKIGFSLVLAF